MFYSGRTAFPEPGRHCIPGLDPGGDPAIQERETVEWRASKTLVGTVGNADLPVQAVGVAEKNETQEQVSSR